MDYDGLFRRGDSGILLDETLLEMAAEDLILTLTVHLVKHAVYLPYLFRDANIIEIILADGMLMYFMDIAAVLNHKGHEIDWHALCKRANDWGMASSLYAVLTVCQGYLGAEIPGESYEKLHGKTSGSLSQSLHRKIAAYQLSTYRGEPKKRLWEFLTVPNGAFILRPVKLVDTWDYLFPESRGLERIYGRSSVTTRIRHFVISTFKMIRFGLDSIRFGVERYRRLKAQDLETSLSTRLETG